MKRDLILIKKLLLYAEEKEVNTPTLGEKIEIDDYTSDEINYHIKLLYQAGFVEIIDASSGRYMSFFLNDLTWDGQTFLELLKRDTTWNKTKEMAKEAGGWAIETIFKALIEYQAKKFGLIV